VNERHQLDDLVKLALQEAKRRGLTIDVTPVHTGGVPQIELTGLSPTEQARRRKEAAPSSPAREVAQGR
jgi:hypothetical protein